MNRNDFSSGSKHKKLDFKIRLGTKVRFNPIEAIAVLNEYGRVFGDLGGEEKERSLMDSTAMEGTISGKHGSRWIVKWNNGFEFPITKKYLYVIPPVNE